MSLSEERLAEMERRLPARPRDQMSQRGRDAEDLFNEVRRLRAGIASVSENWRREWCNERDAQAGMWDMATIEEFREDLRALFNSTEGED